jgi:hypothetical protein
VLKKKQTPVLSPLYLQLPKHTDRSNKATIMALKKKKKKKKPKNKNEIFLRCKTKQKKSSTIGPRKPREKKKPTNRKQNAPRKILKNSATRIQAPEKEIKSRVNRRGNVTQELWLSSSGGVRTAAASSSHQERAQGERRTG